MSDTIPLKWSNFHLLKIYYAKMSKKGVIKQMTETLRPRNISCFQYVKVMTCNLVLRYNYNKMFRLIRRKISISNIFSSDTLVCLLGQAYAALSISTLHHFFTILVAQIRQRNYGITTESKGKIWECSSRARLKEGI